MIALLHRLVKLLPTRPAALLPNSTILTFCAPQGAPPARREGTKEPHAGCAPHLGRRQACPQPGQRSWHPVRHHRHPHWMVNLAAACHLQAGRKPKKNGIQGEPVDLPKRAQHQARHQAQQGATALSCLQASPAYPISPPGSPHCCCISGAGMRVRPGACGRLPPWFADSSATM